MSLILDLLSGGDSIEEITMDYPHITKTTCSLAPPTAPKPLTRQFHRRDRPCPHCPSRRRGSRRRPQADPGRVQVQPLPAPPPKSLP
ncbi:MAG: DUF433 domain-containing protein [Planctomycetes bacterium]|nr:DUF433 domain-containing protein [Planctomycetota bacterium]